MSSFVGRVALTTALSVTVASATVAGGSVLIADRTMRVREDRTLADAAETLAIELREAGADPRWVAQDEAREVEHASMIVAVFDDQGRIAGDPALQRVASGRCRTVGALRTCARAAGHWLALVARDQAPLDAQRHTAIFAALSATLFTSLLGALVALAVARWVARPWERLRKAVEHVSEHDPGSAELGADEQLLEVDALRASLRATFARLAAAMNTSRRFASDAAHELRTPLATLIGELELVAERAPAELNDELGKARRVAARMTSLLDRLLVLARPDALRERERVEARELVEEALENLPREARARVTLDCPSECESVALRGDRTLLVSAVANALENALKFSDGPVRAELSLASASVQIEIVDQGPGLAEAERERVFAPFYRTAASRAGSVPGHGIGLALIAHVLTLHDGSATFIPQERGARLRLTLPTVV
ncbi:MAG TPA: HAMP domain-containing sensor histidine kinase [Polyangiales bacterium]|nr:HAMP domain-containing sensor histidine kinase [Polyangiales bacterium]